MNVTCHVQERPYLTFYFFTLFCNLYNCSIVASEIRANYLCSVCIKINIGWCLKNFFYFVLDTNGMDELLKKRIYYFLVSIVNCQSPLRSSLKIFLLLARVFSRRCKGSRVKYALCKIKISN